MELWWTTPTEGQLPKTTREQTPVQLEHLPAWKQLIMESRQVQTVADLVMAQSQRQITTAKRRIAPLHLLQKRLRVSCYWHCNSAISLHFSEEEEKERCFLFSPYEEVMATLTNGNSL